MNYTLNKYDRVTYPAYIILTKVIIHRQLITDLQRKFRMDLELNWIL